MNGFVKSGLETWKSLGTFLVLGAVAHASLPYLSVVGPPPLRFQARVHHAAPKLAAADLVATNSPLTLAQTKLSPAATALPLAATNGTAVTSSVAPGLDAVPAVGGALSQTVLALPTPDLLGITPQMLAFYFHPVQTGTNATSFAFPISFTPPTPPDKSSQAEYIVK
jgi:hypothetical protein